MGLGRRTSGVSGVRAKGDRGPPPLPLELRVNGTRDIWGGDGTSPPPPLKGDSPTSEDEPDMKVASKDAELVFGASPEYECMGLVRKRSYTTLKASERSRP